MSETGVDALKRKVYREIDRLEEQLRNLAKEIHAHPELNFEECFAVRLLTAALRDTGFRVEEPAGGVDTAFTAQCEGGGQGPAVAFLAEYDALPEVGHACGHNLIAAASAGAAMGVAAVAAELNGEVVLVGTPAEEGGGGKVLLAEQGVFDRVDAAMMFHPAGENQLWKYALASRILRIEFFGKAAHAASAPEKGINALDATIQTFNALNALRQHLREDVKIHGIIEHGGRAPNIVPDYSSSLFYVRSFDDEYCDELVRKVRFCAQGAAAATGARLDFRQLGAYDSLRTNAPLSEAFRRNAEALGVRFASDDPLSDLGSTDMGNVSHITPSIHPYLAIGDSSLVYHSPEFSEAARSGEGLRTMLVAAKSLAGTAIDFFLDPKLREEVRRAFGDQSAGRGREKLD
jgi:amidohydrolase